jgi:hypothetical protein
VDLKLIPDHEVGQLSEVVTWTVAKSLYEVGDLKPVDRRVLRVEVASVDPTLLKRNVR